MNEKANKTVTPNLTCNITGKSRVTNRKYLAAKADKKGTDVDTFLKYYISKDALRQLKAGRSPSEIRADYPDAPAEQLPTGWVKDALKYNGKSGPSGPHAKTSTVGTVVEVQPSLSPEVEKLVQTVQELETVEV